MTIVDWIHNEFEEFDSKNFDGFGQSNPSKDRKSVVVERKDEVTLIRSDMASWVDKRVAYLSKEAENLPQRETTIDGATTPRQMIQERISELQNNPEPLAQQRESLLMEKINIVVGKETSDGGSN